MSANVSVNKDELIVTLVGVFDSSNSMGMTEWLARLSSTLSFGRVTIDLSACQELGTNALSGLVGFRLHPTVCAKSVRIVGYSEEIHHQLNALFFEKLFELSVSR